MSPGQDAISRLCEAWYAKEPASRSEVVPQTILYLLMRSVSEEGKVSDVKRVYNMREALECLEIGGESFRSVQESLMRAAIHPNFVLSEDGRRFLTFLLTLHPLVTSILHKTIKSQIPRCRFGSGEEGGGGGGSDSLQELHARTVRRAVLCGMEAGKRTRAACARARVCAGPGEALHPCEHPEPVQRDPPGSDADDDDCDDAEVDDGCKVLSVFHKNKKYKAVDEMLSRIYEPILWRSLKVLYLLPLFLAAP
eukprot:761649-Hanusia_phi.AAC.1